MKRHAVSVDIDIDLGHALQVARQAAARAGELILQYFGGEFAVDAKADESPVTAADRGAERVIRETLLASFPQHAIYGEEEGHSGDSPYLWLVDPLDGTKSFIRKNPVFAVLIALSFRGEIILGLAHAPAYGQTAWATRGGGAFVDGHKVQVAKTKELRQAALSTGNLKTLARSPAWLRFADLIGLLNRLRGYGDFLHYHMLAAGQLDIVLESDVNILDIAPFVILIREAGGVFTDLRGNEIDLNTSSVLAAANHTLHAAVTQQLAFA